MGRGKKRRTDSGFSVRQLEDVKKLSLKADVDERKMDQARMQQTLGDGYRIYDIKGDGSCWSTSMAVAAEFVRGFGRRFTEDEVRQLVCDTIKGSATFQEFLEEGDDEVIEAMRQPYAWGEKLDSIVPDLVIPAFVEATGCCVSVVGEDSKMETFGTLSPLRICLLKRPKHYHVIIPSSVPAEEVERKIEEVERGKKEADSERARKRLRSSSSTGEEGPSRAKAVEGAPITRNFAKQRFQLEPQKEEGLKFISGRSGVFWKSISKDILESGTELIVSIDSVMDEPTTRRVKDQLVTLPELPKELTEGTQWALGMAVGQANVGFYSRGVLGATHFPWSVLQAVVKLVLAAGSVYASNPGINSKIFGDWGRLDRYCLCD